MSAFCSGHAWQLFLHTTAKYLILFCLEVFFSFSSMCHQQGMNFLSFQSDSEVTQFIQLMKDTFSWRNEWHWLVLHERNIYINHKTNSHRNGLQFRDLAGKHE